MDARTDCASRHGLTDVSLWVGMFFCMFNAAMFAIHTARFAHMATANAETTHLENWQTLARAFPFVIDNQYCF